MCFPIKVVLEIVPRTGTLGAYTEAQFVPVALYYVAVETPHAATFLAENTSAVRHLMPHGIIFLFCQIHMESDIQNLYESRCKIILSYSMALQTSSGAV